VVLAHRCSLCTRRRADEGRRRPGRSDNGIIDVISLSSGSAGVAVLVDLLVLVVGLSALSLAVRRLHDTNKSGFWIFFALIPIIGGITLLVFYILPGKPVPNRFG
jgi:uncharacterized membrane protein YhaH (DUF805 family)